MALKTNYKDDVLNATMNGKRRYRKTDYSDGTFSLEDVTTYDQVGDDFAAKDVNEINKEVNTKFDSGDVVDPMLATKGGFAADALATKKQFDEQNKKLPFAFGIDADGNYGYIKDGADTVIPFKSANIQFLEVDTSGGYTLPEDGYYLCAGAGFYNSNYPSDITLVTECNYTTLGTTGSFLGLFLVEGKKGKTIEIYATAGGVSGRSYRIFKVVL